MGINGVIILMFIMYFFLPNMYDDYCYIFLMLGINYYHNYIQCLLVPLQGLDHRCTYSTTPAE